MSKAAQAYLSTQVSTTNQGELLIMLYDAGIKFMKQAREYIVAKDFAKKGILISKAMDIIAELSSSLNKEQGGQIAENLQAIYNFCHMELAKANIQMSTKKLDDVINIITNIRNAYAQIIPETECNPQCATQPSIQLSKPATSPSPFGNGSTIQFKAGTLKSTTKATPIGTQPMGSLRTKAFNAYSSNL